ncbi:hypothetical protein WM24_23720 [Burkholderia ubonensis]|uniref:hypothetical protein n=1 Tax=Burkholderia ubonensis TaxID=101571 RepID=UPI0007578E9A|nr:hypothetical protein [Burkholderia ubonensis]KWN80848.1 hypothetical protein WM24_23720 [Burkholderia ubonensis]
MKTFVLKQLLRMHENARATPYYDLPGYMLRDWVLGFRSPERNGDNLLWKMGFRPKSSALYRWLCHHIAIRAHTILRSDRDRHLHDHPSWSLSIVLDGGYWEVFEPTMLALRRPVAYRFLLDLCSRHNPDDWDKNELEEARDFGIFWRGPGAIVFRKATCFHRLILPADTQAKSIFAMGRRTNSWGFKTPEGKVYWRTYLGLDKERS